MILSSRTSSSYSAVLVKLSPLTRGCLSIMHSFSIISVNVAMSQ